MRSFSHYKLEEGVDSAPNLEKIMVATIEAHFDLLKKTIESQMRAANSNQDFRGRVRNWLGNLWSGGASESTDSLFADAELIRELNQIVEGPMDQALDQVLRSIDDIKRRLLSSLVTTIRASQLTMPKPKPRKGSADSLQSFSRTISPSADAHSRFIALPGGDFDPTVTYTKVRPDAAEVPDTPTSDPEKPSIAPSKDSKDVPDDQAKPDPKVLDLGVKPSRIVKAPTVDPENDEKNADEEKPKGRPQIKKFIRKYGREGFLDDDSDQKSITPSEVQQHHQVLRLYRPEVKDLYTSEKNPDKKRGIVSFLNSMKKDVMLPMMDDPQIAKVISWLSEFPPDKMAKLGFNLPNNPNLLNHERRVKSWANSILRENPEDPSGLLLMKLREQRLMS